ncbi:MAG: hypothetical protein K1X89_30750, partial [Myxococcaceae bacterium]|nr:hypothetical protein [Myxococcaceae bacterium]
RRAAGQSLSRLLGTDVSALVDLGDSERRRAVRRLGRVEAHPVVNAAQRAAPARVAVAVVEAPAPAVSESQVLLSLRTAIRGRTLGELAQGLGVPEAAALEVCRSLSSQGRVVQRGQKFFVA